MHILVTRPIHQANATAGALKVLGHVPTIEPMLVVDRLATAMPKGPFFGVILTSANALPILTDSAKARKALTLPVLTTGKATAQAARDAGFESVTAHPGSALDLVAHLPAWMEQNGLTSPLLYPCAETTAHNLNEILAEMGISCLHWPVYRTDVAKDFSQTTKQGLQDGHFDAVLLYSRRTAHTFVQLMRNNNLAMEGLRTYVMSKDIYEALPKELQTHAHYPNRPAEADLLHLIAP
ncbi:MAG: uroporphyrinogen-III synthase [Rhizobiaceae bacterium]|nr:uroporphyrinogen-III synthase [Hyphomicrobiales bacterium]NRB29583.1 uroporphyrinogen-III synthase [Rhizobiaceae bacterium]